MLLKKFYKPNKQNFAKFMKRPIDLDIDRDSKKSKFIGDDGPGFHLSKIRDIIPKYNQDCFSFTDILNMVSL
jgi:hypothetical protein